MQRPLGIAFVCERCNRPIYAAPDRSIDVAECAHCACRHSLWVDVESLESRRLQHCLRCGQDRLYVQKDFNRKIGLWVFIVAAVLSVPTWGLSLLVATLVDFGLYYMLGDVTICYGCNTQHRGFYRNPGHGAFDLHVADAIDSQPRAI